MIALLLALGAPAAAAPLPVQSRRAPAVEVWQVDQVRIPRNTPPRVLKALEPDHSLAAVKKRLATLGVPFTTGRVTFVPDRMPAELRKQVAELPEGEPFVIPERNWLSINVVVGRRLPADMVRLTPSLSAAAALQG